MRLAGKVCAITGAGHGIGEAAARLFAREGAEVLLLEIDEAAARGLEADIIENGGKARAYVLNIADEKAVRETFVRIRNEVGRMHVLYNNASIFRGGKDGPVDALVSSIWRQVLSVNLDGLYFCSKYALPLIIESGGGTVIHTASSAALIGVPGCDAYTASKGATVALTRSMAVEYGSLGVRVNCLAPAAIRTEMVKESNLNDPDFDEERFLRVTPIRRWGEPEDIAQAALFLASDESSYINGAVLVADGGSTLVPAFQ
jgi:NAD(P)-dependent dehydrogenase (short-subunit alcohol dehydrogenase family)